MTAKWWWRLMDVLLKNWSLTWSLRHRIHLCWQTEGTVLEVFSTEWQQRHHYGAGDTPMVASHQASLHWKNQLRWHDNCGTSRSTIKWEYKVSDLMALIILTILLIKTRHIVVHQGFIPPKGTEFRSLKEVFGLTMSISLSLSWVCNKFLLDI